MIQTTESFANSIPVLMYHHVSSSGDPLTISPENFESQIGWLARNGYVTLTADEFARFLHGSLMPRKSVLLTFDDGYLGNYVHAHPILLRYGFNAVMFLVTGRVHDGPFRAIGAQRMEAPRSHQACERLVHDGRADEVTVRWSEVELMRAAGTFEFHSHTHSHLRWDQLCANPIHKRQNIALDIEKSKAILTSRLGAGSRHLCWPEGYFDADYIDVAKAAGFDYLYTTRNLRRNVPGSDPWRIHRLVDNGKDAEWLAQKLQRYQDPLWGRAYYWFKRARHFRNEGWS
jgi:peptidoglycan/xylan/chitin deacetylase (PgdA/CDA1 family)